MAICNCTKPHPVLSDTPLLSKERGRGEVYYTTGAGVKCIIQAIAPLNFLELRDRLPTEERNSKVKARKFDSDALKH